MEFLKELNDAQAEAVTSKDGPLLILAGAGSGKTKVLTYRIAYLIKKGLNPSRILAVTFTNKAAEEMKNRIIQLIGNQAKNLWVGTFHSICARILRREVAQLGYKSSFSIYDEYDKKKLIEHCLKELDYDTKKNPPSAISHMISAAKNELVDSETFLSRATEYKEQIAAEVYRLYQERLYQNNALDFDDLIMLTVNIFEINPQTLTRYQEHFQNIFIDEYQDTNRAQYKLISLFVNKQQNICVVGDSDQSIYRWRGADIRNILNFEKDYPQTKIVTLEQNYRSTQKILEAANLLIANNSERKAKNLWSAKDEGDNITVFEANDEHHEANFVAKTISNLVERGSRYSDFAIFYRVNAQSRVLEDDFLREGLPYKIIGGLKFYERAEIKDILAYLRVIVNENDSISLRRIINRPRRGIGETTVAQVNKYSRQQAITFMQALEQYQNINSLTAGAVKRISDFLKVLNKLKRLKGQSPVELKEDGLQAAGDILNENKGAPKEDGEKRTLVEIVSKVLHESGYLQNLKEGNDIESQSRIENLNEFINVVNEFEKRHPDLSLSLFLEEISLIADVDQLEAKDDIVTLMTMHNAKGLEFGTVFVIGMEEGLFPHFRSFNEVSELEEERRLCYVSLTRAQRKLFLSSAYSRNLYGQGSYNVRSRFLAEIPQHLMESVQTPIIAVAEDLYNFSIGDVIEHKKFGRGIITEIQEEKLTVQFEASGSKILIAGYAPITLLQ